MGLLDDAIREHLELKRKHGAAPTDVAQQEAEAFGPVRREPAPEPVAEELVEEEEAYSDEPIAEELEVVDEPVAPAPEAAEPEVYAAEPLEEEPVAETAQPEPYEPVVEPEPAEVDDRAATRALETLPEEELEPLLREEPEYEPLRDDEPELAEEIEPEPRRARSGDTPPYGTPAVEGDEDGDEDDVEDEDVLEETPDFLQETPEHDRLWFEQKPPRDFDFDD